LGVSWTSITRSEQHIHRPLDERKTMTQSSHTSRGIQRPALALALGTAAVATVLAPVASMAATAPTYNDSAKQAGRLIAPSKIGGTTAALQTKRTTPLPATAFPVPTTGTIYGDVVSQALTLSAGTQKAALTTAYAQWKTAATPVVNAWIAYTKAKTPAAKATAMKTYNAKLAVYNKKVAGTYTNGVAKWTAYSSKYGAWLSVYNTQLAAVKSNHFALAAETAFGADCTSTDDRTAAQLGMSDGNNAPANDSFGPNLILKCDTTTHVLKYYLKDNGNGSGWEAFQTKITTDPASGKVSALGFYSDADPNGQSYRNYIDGPLTFHISAVQSWVSTNGLTATKRSDISTFRNKALYNAGVFLNVTDNTCAGTTGATLTCQAFTESLQSALNQAYVKSAP